MQRNLEFATDNRLPRILDRLGQAAPGDAPPSTDPLRQLLFGLVSERVAPAVGQAFFNRMEAEYLNWRCVMEADTAELAAFFSGLPNALDRARTLQMVLQEIVRRCGALDLSTLSRLSTDGARHWLITLPGVSDTVAMAVLAFSTLGRDVACLDEDAARVVRRLRLCPADAVASSLSRHVAERAPSQWGVREFVLFSRGVAAIGRRICRADRPQCGDCLLADFCSYAESGSATIIPWPKRLPQAIGEK